MLRVTVFNRHFLSGALLGQNRASHHLQDRLSQMMGVYGKAVTYWSVSHSFYGTLLQ